MIRVQIQRRTADDSIRSFTVKGHADYAESGKDIVCAGVSTVTVGTVNAAEAVLGIQMEAGMKHGWVEASVPAGLSEDLEHKLQLLLESMVVMLQSIEQSYGSYITIEQRRR
ncbi:hypothetical protein J31TS4_24870 [Paenibacillus sp. J31TS4]|uniref:ribosomal-processing cysteine protease Prp n=1 Tax=Paenibacillus sp. J31TS4 TaxID=2807195 RepID=UPI001AFDE92D|nr:ribosomal-processing cysteine protease Prp [Paenibacillus sp. J31TS4]GIP39207.1 hypothetical protein J31TS4_24870 [Paenibacillus sp. J31TS4]